MQPQSLKLPSEPGGGSWSPRPTTQSRQCPVRRTKAKVLWITHSRMFKTPARQRTSCSAGAAFSSEYMGAVGASAEKRGPWMHSGDPTVHAEGWGLGAAGPQLPSPCRGILCPLRRASRKGFCDR